MIIDPGKTFIDIINEIGPYIFKRFLNSQNSNIEINKQRLKMNSSFKLFIIVHSYMNFNYTLLSQVKIN